MNPAEMLKDWEKAFVLFRENWANRNPEEPPNKTKAFMFWSGSFGALFFIVIFAIEAWNKIFHYKIQIHPLVLAFLIWVIGGTMDILKSIQEFEKGEPLFTKDCLPLWQEDRKAIIALKGLPLLSRQYLRSHMAKAVAGQRKASMQIGGVIALIISIFAALPPLAELLLTTRITSPNAYYSPPIWILPVVIAAVLIFGFKWLGGISDRYNHWIFLLDQSLEDAEAPKQEEKPPTWLERFFGFRWA
jgi:hypothetical protein